MKNKILEIFKQISKIPRCSGNIEPISNWIKDFAQKHNLNFQTDKFGNMFVRNFDNKTAQNIMTMQAHVDMVCQKNSNSKHDFNTCGIDIIIEKNIIKASNTSLGADNGLGMAIMLYEITTQKDKNIELIFTLEEETGLFGATNLDPNFIYGNEIINLDSEEEGEIIIGCAGGRDYSLSKNFTPIKNNLQMYKISINNLLGGHSGVDIDKNRINAITCTINFLQKYNNIQIISANGGTTHNAIPRNFEIIFTSTEISKILEDIDNLKSKLKNETKDVNFSCEVINETNQFSLSYEDSKEILNLISELPNNVIQKDQNNIISSANIATITISKNKKFNRTDLNLTISIRSSENKNLNSIENQIDTISNKYNLDLQKQSSYPPWEPNLNSALLNKITKNYKKLFNNEPKISIIHAGLECGILKQKKPNAEFISIGPTIKYPHSPNEYAIIDSINKIVKLIEA